MKKTMAGNWKSKAKIKLKDSVMDKVAGGIRQNKGSASKNVDSGQKILLKIKAGTSMTVISPGKEERHSHLKHKKKKKKLDKERPPSVSLKNGLVLTIRPALSRSESKKVSKEKLKSRTKLKPLTNNRTNSVVEQTSGLKLKIRTNPGSIPIISNSAAEQQEGNQNSEKGLKLTSNKQSGSVIASKNIVKKYKNKKVITENADPEHGDNENYDDKLFQESVSRVKNGIIIHKDKLGNYTSAEQIGIIKQHDKKAYGQKFDERNWDFSKADPSKSPKSTKIKKTDIPKFTKGLWEIMPSPRPDGTPDLLKIRLSPQKPFKLDTRQDAVFESARILDVDLKSKGESFFSEDSDVYGASPATDKDLDMGINVNDSGIEVLSSSSCNRSNGNSVRSVLLDENSPSYFHGEDSLMSFDSPINDSSKYEHSICGKCGGIVMEPNNNTQSPTKCQCDSGATFQDKTSYICISPLKDTSIAALDADSAPKFRMDEITSFVNVASEGFDSLSDTACVDEKSDGRNFKLAGGPDDIAHEQAAEKSVFDFNDDEDFSEGKPTLDHVKNPLILNKTEAEKKQESVLLGNFKVFNQSQVPKKKSNSKSSKLSRSPRKTLKADSGKNKSPSHEKGKLSSKPIVIEDEEDEILGMENFKQTLNSKSTEFIECKDQHIDLQTKQFGFIDEQVEYSLKLKNNVVCDTNEPIIVAIAKTEKSVTPSSETEKSVTPSSEPDTTNTSNGTILSSESEEIDNVADSKISENEQISDKQINTSDIKHTESEQDSDKQINKSDAKHTENDLVRQEQNNGISEDEQASVRQINNAGDCIAIVNEQVSDAQVINTDDSNTSEKELDMEEMLKENINGTQSSNTEKLECEKHEVDFESKRDSSEVLLNKKTLLKENNCETISNDGNTNIAKDFCDKVCDTEKIEADITDPGENKKCVNEIDLDNENYKSDNAVEIESELKRLDTLTDKNVEEETPIINAGTMNVEEHPTDMGEVKSKVAESKGQKDNVIEQNLCKMDTVATMTLDAVSVDGKQDVAKINSDEDSLLQIPSTEMAKDSNESLINKVSTEINSDEDSLMTIPVEANVSTSKKTSGIHKSPLDLFQQQFLSFLHTKPPEAVTDSDMDDVTGLTIESDKDNTEDALKQQNISRVNTLSKTCTDSQKSTESKKHSLKKIMDTDSESDFDSRSQGHRGRKKSVLNEKKKRVQNIDENRRLKEGPAEKSENKNKDYETEYDFVHNANSKTVLEEPVEISDSGSDFETHSIYGKDRKKSFVKRKRNRSDPHCGKKRKFRDFDSDDSDFVLSGSECDGFSLCDTDENDPSYHTDTEYDNCRMSKTRTSSRASSSVSQSGKHKKEGRNYPESADSKSLDSTDFRRQRSRKSRKSCCPCCLGSPSMGRKERHVHKKRYKLPRNHKQFIQNTMKLLEMKAKIHGLFLSLFPQCEELLKQSAFDTVAFDDVIDDVLSSLVKPEIQFEPNNEILTTETAALYNPDPLIEQVPDEHLTLQMSKGSVDTDHDLEGAALNESICLVHTASPVTIVPGIHLMYSDDSVINASPVTNVDNQEGNNSLSSTNLLPPLPLCDIEDENHETLLNVTTSDRTENKHPTEASSLRQSDNSLNEHSPTLGSRYVDDVLLTANLQQIHPSNNSLQTIPVTDDLSLAANSQEIILSNNSLHSVPVSDDLSLAANSQEIILSNNSLQTIPVTDDLSLAANSQEIILSNNSLQTIPVSDDVALKANPQEISVSNNSLQTTCLPESGNVTLTANSQTLPFSNNSLQAIAVSEGTDLGSNSQNETSDVIQDTQFCLSNTVDQVVEKSLEEIVITIDLNAAKVVLCKNPKACLKQLHSRIICLIQSLYPELQISPIVYESLENLEFLIDLMTMSNRSGNFEGTVASHSLISKDMKFVSSKATDTSPQENVRHVSLDESTTVKTKSVLSLDENVSRQLRIRSCDDNSIQSGPSEQKTKSLKRSRTKSVENKSEQKKPKLFQNSGKLKPTSVVHKDPIESDIRSSEKAKYTEKANNDKSKLSLSNKMKDNKRRKSQSHTDHIKNPVRVVETIDLTGDEKTSLYSLEPSVFKGLTLKSQNGIQNTKNSKIKSKFSSDCAEHLEDSSVKSRDKRTKTFSSEKCDNSNKDDDVIAVKLPTVKTKLDSVNSSALSKSSEDIFTLMSGLSKSDDKLNISCNGLNEKSPNREDADDLLQVHSLINLEREGKVNETKPASDKSLKGTDTPAPSPSSHLVRTPSPEKNGGGFSPDSKRRSIDKNIFELLQPTSIDPLS